MLLLLLLLLLDTLPTLITFTASTFLPSPQNVTMCAVDVNYTLRWSWSSTPTPSLNNVTFTAEYTYWNSQEDEASYKRVCEGSSERRCDFSAQNLPFSGSYVMRVRAESDGRSSNWSRVRFTPDEDVVLGRPGAVGITAGVDVLTLTIGESPLRFMKVQYRVVYWERRQPQQRREEVLESAVASLVSLKPGTEYCLQVSFFSPDYEKSSELTRPQCHYTTGHPLVWVKVLPVVLCVSALVGFLTYGGFKMRKPVPAKTQPNSILGFPLDIPSLLKVQEDSYSTVLVIPDTRPEPELEPELDPEQMVTSSLWTSGSQADSGIASGEES